MRCKRRKALLAKKVCENKCFKTKTKTVARCVKASCKAASNPSPTPDPKAKDAMAELLWDENNKAIVEFCQVGNTAAFGYRPEGYASCLPAGLVIRLTRGETYELTIRNVGSEATNVHAHGVHISGEGNADDITRQVQPGMQTREKHRTEMDPRVLF